MPMPERYKEKIPELISIWEAEGNFNAQTSVWVAQCEAKSELYGFPTPEGIALIREAVVLTPDDVLYLIEPEGHETNKLLRRVQGRLPQDIGNEMHKGGTSSDVLDTSLAIQVCESIDICKNEFGVLADTILRRSAEHSSTLQVARTHTQHAIVQTFERQLLGWYAEVLRGVERLERAKQVIAVGKLSGEVGTNVYIPPELEELALKKLGLRPDEAPTQIISRDRHAEVIALLAVNGGTLARIATNIRLLSMTDVGEVREPFAEGSQQGSSAMPHKRNPEIAERVVGLNRRIRGASGEEMDAAIAWLERDISHSSTERFTFPDAFGCLLYATRLTTQILDGLEVDPEKMKDNINKTFGAIYSSRLLNMLLDKGAYSRTEGYDLVKRLALDAMKTKTLLYELAINEPLIIDKLTQEEIEDAFDPSFYLRNIDVAKKRLGVEDRFTSKTSG